MSLLRLSLPAALRRGALAAFATLAAAPLVATGAGAQPSHAFSSTTAGGTPIVDGNQTFAGTLSNQFRVLSEPVRITAFGAFDDGIDGFQRTITIRLYDATTEQQVGDALTFTGTVGTTAGAYRFLELSTPIVLPVGFVGRIAAFGYGFSDERYYNAFANGDRLVGVNGGGLIAMEREYYADDESYPTLPSGSGVPGWYGAANFAFERVPLQSTVPEPASVALVATGVAVLGAGAARRRKQTGA